MLSLSVAPSDKLAKPRCSRAQRLNARVRSALREHSPYFVVTVALALAGAAAYVTMVEKRYEARAEVHVARASPADVAGLPALRAGTFGRGVEVAARLVESPAVMSRVRRRLDLSDAGGNLVEVTTHERAGILWITGIAGTPAAAAEIANAFAGGFVAERTRRFQQQLQRAIRRTTARLDALGAPAAGIEATSLADRLADYRALSGATDPTIEIIRMAAPPSSPVWPDPAVIFVAAFALALLAGAALVVLLEATNPTIVTADALAEPSAPPVLARISRPTPEETRERLLATATVSEELPEPLSQLSESIAAILPNGSAPRAFLFTSPDAREGTAAVAATVAALFADAGIPVALLDVDLDRAPVRALMNGNGTRAPSVGEIVASGDGRYLHHLHRVESGGHRLRLVLADRGDRQLPITPHDVEALASELKSRVSALVISSPPLPSKETAALLGLADEVIVVVSLGRTRRDRLTDLRRTLALRNIDPYGYVALDS